MAKKADQCNNIEERGGVGDEDFSALTSEHFNTVESFAMKV